MRMPYRELKIDELGFKVGDIITTYKKGFWRVTKIEDRSSKALTGRHVNPLITYVKVANTTGDFINGVAEFTCDASYCHPLSKTLNNLKELSNKLKNSFSKNEYDPEVGDILQINATGQLVQIVDFSASYILADPISGERMGGALHFRDFTLLYRNKKFVGEI